MEGWMFNALVSVGTIVATFTVLKVTVSNLVAQNKYQSKKIDELEKFKNEKEPLLNHLSKADYNTNARFEKMIEVTTKMSMEVENRPTMKDVRDEFVSKEIFLQMEKHFDEKFSNLSLMISKVLENQERMLDEK